MAGPAGTRGQVPSGLSVAQGITPASKCVSGALTRYNLCKTPSKTSRIYIVNWDLRESMTESDIEIILERAKELHPGARPRIIFDNGPQFIAKDFKEFIRISGMTHVRNSPYYPQPPSVSLEVM